MTEIQNIILSKIYNLRALNFNQIEIHLLRDKSPRYIQDTMSGLCKSGLLAKTGWKKEEAYYTITNKGINLLRKQGNTCSKTAAELSFEPVYSAHQLALNDFVLDFEDIAKGEYAYYDEKFMSKILKNIRPDGVLVYKGIWYFLEMDMNTERAGRLEKKWQSYRYFLNSNEYEQFSDKIRVLFILGGNGGEARKHQLWSLIISNLGDKLSDRFDILAADQDTLISYIFSPKPDIPPGVEAFRKEGYRVETGDFNSGVLAEYPSDGYMVKEKDGEVVVKDGQRMEFIADDFSYERISIINKIGKYDGIRAALKSSRGVSISYLVITKSGNQKKELEKYLGRMPEGVIIEAEKEGR